MAEWGYDYCLVEPPEHFEVMTVVPYHPEPEDRRYKISGDELHLFPSEVENDDHGERVVTVTEAPTH